jgi:hypothetical protein
MPRPKLDYRSASRESYQSFCKDHPQIKMSFELFKQIIYTINEVYASFVLEGEKIKLPQGFGSIAINKKKQVKKIVVKGKEKMCLAIDWNESRKQGKKIYHLNAHTDGYRYKWFWFKAEAFLPDIYLWGFNATRIGSRTLAKYLKMENSPYVHLYKEYSANYTT